MNNPFEKRASEYFRDDESFLAVVSPEPLTTYLRRYANSGRLYDRLVVMRGAPGSGKTTIAQLFEYHRIVALLRHAGNQTYKPLVAALAECRAIVGDRPAVLGCRIPMESGYRDVWQFPYSAELRTRLLTALIQARAMLGWLRNIEKSGVDIADIRIVPRSIDEAAVRAIGGTDGPALLDRARAVEYELYTISAALIPPDVDKLREGAIGAYHPFDVIGAFNLQRDGDANDARPLHPLVVLDDAQTLHAAQFTALHAWLTRREPSLGRWILSWLDVVSPEEVLHDVWRVAGDETPDQPGIDPERVVTRIYLQSGYTSRKRERRAFRKTAKDMADRYLQQMPLFASRGIQRFETLLHERVEPLPKSTLADLRSRIAREQREAGVAEQRRRVFEDEVERYQTSSMSNDLTPDLKIAMVRIMMHRYAGRRQRSLFGSEDDVELGRPIVADSDVAEGARVHLLHFYERPFYYGIDDLCDAGSENAEQFLRLAAALVDRASTQVTRAKPARLSAEAQHEELRQRAKSMFAGWSFPNHDSVRRLVDAMARRCVEESLSPNAWLGAGANAFGVHQEDFDRVHQSHPSLARTLQLGIAYNALTLVPEYSCKGHSWCLIELGGVPLLSYGLTLKRGGFIESTVSELDRLVRLDRPSIAAT